MAARRPLTRSEQMARIRGTNTVPELVLRRALREEGIPVRPYFKTPVGKPDLACPSQKVAVFIDGCFWHGCPEHYVRPRSREKFWLEKLRSTFERDRWQTVELERQGWRVVRVWEHDVFTNLLATVARIREAVEGRARRGRAWRVVQVTPVVHQQGVERRFLQDLRKPELARMVVRERSTAKWPRRRC